MPNAYDIKGKWNGNYRYDKPQGHAGEVLFEMHIPGMQGLHFTGTVQDNVQTGGMEGEGSIAGEIKNNSIRFKKQMPLHSMMLPGGMRGTTGKKHPVIYYSGTYSAAENKMTGTWKIKGRIFLHNRRLYISRKTTGTWQMHRVDN